MQFEKIQSYPKGVSKLPPLDHYVAAGVESEPGDINQEGRYVGHYPAGESQIRRAKNLELVDDYGCTSHSCENAVETGLAFQGDELNLDDRFLVVASGTVPNVGNDGQTVIDTLGRYGCPLEGEVPGPEGMTINEYYSLMWRDFLELAERFKDKYDVRGYWKDMEDPDAVAAALRKGVIQVYIPSLGYSNGKWYMAGKSINHAVCCLDNPHLGDWHLGDSYQSNGSFVKVMAAGQKPYRWGLLITVRPKNVTAEQKTLEFVQKHLNKTLFVNQSGARYLVLGPTEGEPHGRIKHVSRESQGVAAMIRQDYGMVGPESVHNIDQAEIAGLIVTEV